MYREAMLCKYCDMQEAEIYQPKVTRIRRELPVRGIQYCVYEWGKPDAPLLVYLHGWADTGSTFQFVVDEFASEWRVIAPDWRGFGRSGHGGTSYWFPDYIADLHGLLREYSPAEPARVVAHSMGANIASLYAGTMPERVGAFVNIEGFGLPDSDPGDAPKRYRDWIESAEAAPDFSRYDDFVALADRINKRHPSMRGPQCQFVAREWAAKEAQGGVRLRADPRHKLPNPVLYRRAEAAACCQAITASTLLIIGSSSAFAEHFQGADIRLFPGTETIRIEGAGHMPHFEAPGELAAAIEEFLLPTL